MNITRFFLAIVAVFTTFLTTPESAAAASEDQASSAALEVMTYNIRTGRAKDGLDAWPVRAPRTLQVLEKYKPDIIGLQEAQAFQVIDLLTSMTDYAVVGAGRGDGRIGNELSAIMYRTSRLQLLRSDTFWLSETPEVPASTHWGNVTVRVCTWAHFRDLKTDKTFYHFNTHLDHISQESRVKSAKLIMQRIQQIRPQDAIVITGDLNAGEENPAIAAIRNAGYRDTFRLLHPNEKNVGTLNGFKPERGTSKIDYIFVDENWVTLASAIPDDKVDGRWPSDHLPVIATLTQK